VTGAAENPPTRKNEIPGAARVLKTTNRGPFTCKPLQGKIVFFLEWGILFIDKGPFNG
jgi:hypothetical protein